MLRTEKELLKHFCRHKIAFLAGFWGTRRSDAEVKRPMFRKNATINLYWQRAEKIADSVYGKQQSMAPSQLHLGCGAWRVAEHPRPVSRTSSL